MQAALSSEVWGAKSQTPKIAGNDRVDVNDRRLQLVLRLVEDISRFPRHLSQHVGGFVITRGRLDHLCPISPALWQAVQPLNGTKMT